MNKLEVRECRFDEHDWDVPYVILEPQSASPSSCIAALLDVTEDLSKFISQHPGLDDDEPWFGWAFETDGKLVSEQSVFENAVKDGSLREKVRVYVERVIDFSVANRDNDIGFYVHEEKEAGSDAIMGLVKAEPGVYFPLYLRYLGALDLEHTVAQHGNVVELWKVINPQQRADLAAFLSSTNGGQNFFLPDAD